MRWEGHVARLLSSTGSKIDSTEKLTVIQLVWKPCSQEPATSPIPIVGQMHPIHTFPPYLRSILILSSHLRPGLPTGFFPSSFATKILYVFLSLPCMLHAHLILIDLIVVILVEGWSTGVQFPAGAGNFSLRHGCVQTGSYPMTGGGGLFPRRLRGRGVKLTTHLNLIHGAMPPLLSTSSWHGTLMARKDWWHDKYIHCKVNVKLSLCLTKHRTMKTYWVGEV
jgi:hypothetical protein